MLVIIILQLFSSIIAAIFPFINYFLSNDTSQRIRSEETVEQYIDFLVASYNGDYKEVERIENRLNGIINNKP